MSGEPYGYGLRPPMPDRFVPGSVVEPRNQWPRGIKAGTGGSGGFVSQALQLLNSSNVEIIGAGLTLSDTTSDGTIVTTTNGWDATFKRTGRITDLTGTHAVNRGSNRALSMWELSPTILTHAPIVVRMSAVVAGRSTTMPAGGSAGIAFGLCSYSTSPIKIPTNAAIQFVSTWTDPAVSGLWSTWISSSSGTFTRATNLGFSTLTPHLLEIEFCGTLNLINFYVDGELVDAFIPGTGEIFNHVAGSGTNIEFIANASNTGVTRMMYLCDMIPLVSVTLTDLSG
jgi:hypothetical protein